MMDEFQPTERHGIEENAALLTFTEIVSQGLGFLVSMLVARILGVESYGLLAFAYSFALMCLVIPSFGFARLAVRELARKPSRAGLFLSTIPVIMWALSLPIAGICVLVVWISSHSFERISIVIPVFFIMALQQHIEFVCSFYRARQNVAREALIRTTLAFLWAIAGAAILVAGFRLLPLVASRLVVTIFCLAWATVLIRKDFRIHFKPFRWRYGKALLTLGASFAVFHIINMIFSALILVMLGFMRGDADAGYYSAADKIVTLLFVIPMSLAWAAFPVLSTLWVSSREGYFTTYRMTVRYLILMAVPFSVATYLLGDRAVTILFGTDFAPAVPVLKVLAFGMIPFFLIQINNVALIAMNKQATAIFATILGCLVAVISSALLVPGYGPLGSALSRTLAIICLLMGGFYGLFRGVCTTGMAYALLRSLFAGFIMAAVLVLFRYVALPFFLTILCGAAVYGAVLIVTGELGLPELRRASAIIPGIIRPFRRDRQLPKD
jgi:O-antigen/teichoic acid export membrane protein